MLRLVPPPGAQGQDPPKPARRKGHKPAALFLTAEEARHTRVSLRNTARAYGGMDVLATVLGVPVETLYQASNPKRPLSGIFAIRIAGAAGMSVEAILTGAIGDADKCSTCGSRAGDRPQLSAGGSR